MKLLPPKNFRHVMLKNCLSCRYRQPDPDFVREDSIYGHDAFTVCLRDTTLVLEHDPESSVCNGHRYY